MDKKRRSGLSIMASLIGLVKPLIVVMIGAICLGTLGFLCAIFLTILAGQVVLTSLGFADFVVRNLVIALVVLAIGRGILHYAEQYCNHFIAFKLLAIIRHKIFMALRKLCPAKLEGKDKGNLISLITTDIELLEVFYAHTISPILIAILTSIVMVIFIGSYSIWAGIFAASFYVIVGAFIPLLNGKKGGEKGLNFRNKFGNLNSYVLESLRGLDESIQYNVGDIRQATISCESDNLAEVQRDLSKMEGWQRMATNLAILMGSFGMLFLTIYLNLNGQLAFDGVIICTIAMMGSFGPVVALSNLSNNLNQTLASGERVLSLLEEEPIVEEVSKTDGCHLDLSGGFNGAKASGVNFAYQDETILKDFSMDIEPGKIIGIHGASGSGKSTFLKLLMRFWDVNEGKIEICHENVKNISTDDLRKLESFVTQETHLFKDTIGNNIAIGKKNATLDEIKEAAKKAAIDDFIMSLPNGYDTQVGELGDTLSGGEKQRIGIARAMIHDAPLILMDEPTSNLDSLNESIILKALKESSTEKTVVLVSHRKSTMNIADRVIEMENGRIS